MFAPLARLTYLVIISGLTSLSIFAADLPLKFIGAVQIPNDAMQDGVPIGGLSSIGYDTTNNELFAVCDDKALKGGPRVHHFNVEVSADKLNIRSSRVTLLTNADGGKIYPERIVDAEGLVVLPDGNFLVTSEGIDVEGYFALPSLLVFNQQGHFLSEWHIPDKFLPKGKRMVDFGVRPNDAFESLTLTPDQNTLFMANEKALIQDGDVPTLQSESPIRVIKYKRNKSSFQPQTEYVYHISAIPMINDDPQTTGFRSVSDMMALDHKRLLVIEKSFYIKPVTKNSVQIFLAEITEHNTEVSAMDALADIDYEPLKKTLWIDLDQFEGTKDFPDLDNVEGITFGPQLENGNQTIILVTDNNFSPRQRNLFYAFEILSPE